jgi:hypothetical protein
MSDLPKPFPQDRSIPTTSTTRSENGRCRFCGLPVKADAPHAGDTECIAALRALVDRLKHSQLHNPKVRPRD